MSIRKIQRGNRHIGQTVAQLNDLIPAMESEYDYILSNYGKPAEDSALELLHAFPLLQQKTFNTIRKAK